VTPNSTIQRPGQAVQIKCHRCQAFRFSTYGHPVSGLPSVATRGGAAGTGGTENRLHWPEGGQPRFLATSRPRGCSGDQTSALWKLTRQSRSHRVASPRPRRNEHGHQGMCSSSAPSLGRPHGPAAFSGRFSFLLIVDLFIQASGVAETVRTTPPSPAHAFEVVVVIGPGDNHPSP